MKGSARLILITDDNYYISSTLTALLSKAGYKTISAVDGQQCLELIHKHKPKLIFLDLMLPKIHGMDILRELKSKPETKEIGVIIMTGKMLIQDYQTAIENGADYYLPKPLDTSLVLRVAKDFFEDRLTPDPFPAYSERYLNTQELYNPQTNSVPDYIRFWGTRGSIPVSGLEYYRYGGNTPCLEVRQKDHLIIIDAGTGIRQLGNEVLKENLKEIHLFIGHTHWDHIIGFPFFAPVYVKNCTINIYAPKGFGKSIQELFTGMLDRDYFPVRLEEMQAKFIFHTLSIGNPVKIGDVEIDHAYSSHPGATLCFKIKSKRQTIGYVTDNEVLVGYHGHPNLIDRHHLLLDPHQSLITFFQGCDVLVHEAQYTPEEYRQKVGWGHSSISNAAVLIKHAGITNWVFTHHDPSHNDVILLQKLNLHQTIMRECGLTCQIQAAYEGLTLPL